MCSRARVCRGGEGGGCSLIHPLRSVVRARICMQTAMLEHTRATHCYTLQHTATHCNTLQHTAATLKRIPARTHALTYSDLHLHVHAHGTATHYNTLQHIAAYYNTLQHTTTHCSILQHTATHYNTLQHTAAYCNTLHHTAATSFSHSHAHVHPRVYTQVPRDAPSIYSCTDACGVH